MDESAKQQYINFDVYIRQGEPAQRERADAWRVADTCVRRREYQNYSRVYYTVSTFVGFDVDND